MRDFVGGDDIGDLLEPYRAVDRTQPVGPSWVLANMVAGLDGSTAIAGRVGALSEGADALLFRALRSIPDIILVGAETVRAERYRPVDLPEDVLALRLGRGQSPTPRFAIVSASLTFDWSIPVFADAQPEARPLLVTTETVDAARRSSAADHAEIMTAGRTRVDLAMALAALAGRGHRIVLCEGGPTLLGGLAAANLLDELCLTITPVMGGDPLPIAVTPPGAALSHYRIAHTIIDGDVLFLRYERA